MIFLVKKTQHYALLFHGGTLKTSEITVQINWEREHLIEYIHTEQNNLRMKLIILFPFEFQVQVNNVINNTSDFSIFPNLSNFQLGHIVLIL